MTGYMYILKCADNSYYTGSTKNIERRLWQHQNGEGAKYTIRRLPVELVFVEMFDRIDEAFQREKQVQGWSRKKKEALMAGDFNQIHKLAACQNDTHYLSLDSISTSPNTGAQPVEDSTLPSRREYSDKLCKGFDSAQPAEGGTFSASLNTGAQPVEGGTFSASFNTSTQPEGDSSFPERSRREHPHPNQNNQTKGKEQ